MRSLLVFALTICVAASAASEILVFEYRAAIEPVHPGFASIATAGDRASGRVTHDSVTLDTDPAVGWYPGATHEAHFGSCAGTSTQSEVRILDTGSFDAFQGIDFGSADELAAIDGLPVNSAGLSSNGCERAEPLMAQQQQQQ